MGPVNFGLLRGIPNDSVLAHLFDHVAGSKFLSPQPDRRANRRLLELAYFM